MRRGPRVALIARALAAAAALAIPGGRAGAGPPAPSPPRVDGGYVGVAGMGATTFVRVDDRDVPGPLTGPAGAVSVGDAVFPWLTVGASFVGAGGLAPGKTSGWGGLLIDFGVLPVPRVALSLRLGLGFGAGAVLPEESSRRFGFGGALFRGAVRYELFPLAARRRPDRGGGWAIGPELGWIGHTPAAAGRPMANSLYLGIFSGFYFGS